MNSYENLDDHGEVFSTTQIEAVHAMQMCAFLRTLADQLEVQGREYAALAEMTRTLGWHDVAEQLARLRDDTTTCWGFVNTRALEVVPVGGTA